MLKRIVIVFVLAVMVLGWSAVMTPAVAQEEPVEAEMVLDEDAGEGADEGEDKGLGFFRVVASGGFLGIVLWLALGAASVAGVALIVDSFITIREKKIAPESLVEDVRTAMEQGDVMKALKHCEDEPGPLANILSAGFSNVQEGFEAIQD